jgi:hypothetical protein
VPQHELRARVLAAAASAPSPTRGRTWARNIALAVAATAVPVALFRSFYGMRLDARPELLVRATAGGAAVIALGVSLLALFRGRSMLGRRRSTLLALVIGVPLMLLLWKLGATLWFPKMFVLHLERHGFRCLALGCLLAPAPLAAVLWSRRGTDFVQPTLSGATLGVAVGAVAWVFVDLWCPVTDYHHLLLGHVLPVLLTTLVGAIAGRRVLDLPAIRPSRR